MLSRARLFGRFAVDWRFAFRRNSEGLKELTIHNHAYKSIMRKRNGNIVYLDWSVSVIWIDLVAHLRVHGVVIGPPMALPPGETVKNIAPMWARAEVAFALHIPIDKLIHESNVNAFEGYASCSIWTLLYGIVNWGPVLHEEFLVWTPSVPVVVYKLVHGMCLTWIMK